MLEFSFEALDESATAFRRIENFLQRSKELIGKTPDAVIAEEFAAVMNDDLSVPQALALISDWQRNGNTALTNRDAAEVAKFASYIRGALDILGCDPFDAAYSAGTQDLSSAVDGLIALLLEQREAARARKDFAAADSIRDRITAMGISIEDTPQGPRWSIS